LSWVELIAARYWTFEYAGTVLICTDYDLKFI